LTSSAVNRQNFLRRKKLPYGLLFTVPPWHVVVIAIVAKVVVAAGVLIRSARHRRRFGDASSIFHTKLRSTASLKRNDPVSSASVF